jgi:hypothetical protein
MKNDPTITGVGNIEVGDQYSGLRLDDGNTHFSYKKIN